MSSTQLPTEISDQLLATPTARVIIRVKGVADRVATVGELSEAIAPLGLEITTKDAVDWSEDYPGRSEAVTRICELERELADLQHSIDQRGFDPLPVPIEKKEAAE